MAKVATDPKGNKFTHDPVRGWLDKDGNPAIVKAEHGWKHSDAPDKAPVPKA